ncbi:hypothetical protein BKA93DRAFT_877843 [Sparassis latifolia]
MPRENSFSDEGRSLTPDLEDAIEREALHDAAEAMESGTGRPTFPAVDIVSTPTVLSSGAQSMPPLTPGDRFRRTVRKVMAMHRTSRMMSRGGIGAEPGVDPRRASARLRYGNVKQRCIVEVAEYSTMRSSFGRMSNRELIKYLADPGASRREAWVKVRWINVGGISYDVVSALALKYDIHPLALEDVLHRHGSSRSKVDYYPKHLFIRVSCHSLRSADGSTPNSSVTTLPRSASPDPLSDEDLDDDGAGKEDDERTMYESASGSRFSTKRDTMKRRKVDVTAKDVESLPMKLSRFSELYGDGDDKKVTNARNRKLIRELKKGDRVNVRIQPVCIFLFRDGTVISICEDPNLDYTAPIMERIRLRDSAKMSAVVDQALEVVEEYQSKILNIEQAVLIKPNVRTVRRLHILQGDLILHKRTLEPIKTVIYGLRRYDDDRAAALLERVDPHMKIEGYMSHKAKIYLADVHDHMEYILTNLDMFAGVCDNLINYTFNMASYEMNDVMRRLTMATIIFLPLTLLTGYFGMNFENMWSIHHNHTDVIFWIIALPLMTIVITMFMWSDLKKMAHYVDKRLMRKKVKRVGVASLHVRLCLTRPRSVRIARSSSTGI